MSDQEIVNDAPGDVQLTTFSSPSAHTNQSNQQHQQLGVTVAFNHLSLVESVLPPEDVGIQTLVSPFVGLARALASGCKGSKKQDFTRIDNVSGVILPGTMTLILGSPGSGKSSLLRLLSTHTLPTSGTLTYNGICTSQLASQHDLDPRRIAQYMAQTDVHLPTFRVEDTIQFAFDCANNCLVGSESEHLLAKPLHDNGETGKYSAKVEQVIDLLHLHNCRHTNVGDQDIRGVSGGEAKRVSIAEILMSNAKLLCLDQFSDGLDAYVAQHITHELKKWTRSTGGSVVATLQQPTTGIFDLFDDIILLDDGKILYHGPSRDIIAFLADAGHQIPADADPGDFIINVLSEPLYTSGIYIPAFSPDKEKKRKTRRNFNRPSVSNRSYSVITGGDHEHGSHLTGSAELYDSDDDSDDLNVSSSATVAQERVSATSANPAASGPSTEQEHGGQPNTSTNPPQSRQICLTPEDFLVLYQRSSHWMHHQTIIERIRSSNVADLFANNPFANVYEFKSAKEASQSTAAITTDTNESAATPTLEDFVTLDTYKFLYSYSSSSLSMKSSWKLFWLLTMRQFYVTLAIPDMTLIPIAISIFMGIFLGTTSYQIEASATTIAKFNSMACLSASQFSFFNFPALQGAINQSRVAIRQYSNRFYNSPLFIAATTIASLPITLIQTVIFVTLIYWLCGFNADAARFIYTLLFMVLASIQLNILFRFLAFIEPLGEAGKAFAGSLNGVGIVFSGAFVTVSNIPVYLREFYYALPFSWTARGMLLIEFLSDKYTSVDIGTTNLGHLYLESLDLVPDRMWLLYCVLYHVGTSILLYIATIFLLRRRFHFEGIQQGTKRHKDEELEQFLLEHHKNNNSSTTTSLHPTPGSSPQSTPHPSEGDDAVAPLVMHTGITIAPGAGIVVEAKEDLKTLSSVLQFRPYTLSFENLSYTVPVVVDGKKQDKVLLSNINGVIAPGKLTVLMGASGAGKTTCLDVLAFRKTNGTIKGTIRLNNQIATKELVTRVTGYVEQFEAVFGYSTVYETLLFVANLKMDKAISTETKTQIIEEILEVLEISQIRNMLVGNAIIPGISVSELKRLGVAMQLLSNPSILFLDEPTTGLDSHDALVVMRVIKRVSRTRCVVLTIHQPSSELFFLCDRLVLLAQGQQIYCGDIGPRARDVVKYFHNNCGDVIRPLPHRYNPSTWLLELTHHATLGLNGPDAEENSGDAGDDTVDVQQQLQLAQQHQQQPMLTTIASAEEPTQQPVNIDHKKPMTSHEVAQVLIQRFKDSQLCASNMKAVHHVATHERLQPTTTAATSSSQQATKQSANHNIFYQFHQLLTRNFMASWRNHYLIGSRFFTILFLAVVLGLIYKDVSPTDQASTATTISAKIIVPCFTAILTGGAVILIDSTIIPTLQREKFNDLYPAPLWGIVGFTLECFWSLIDSILMSVSYFIISSNRLDDAQYFFMFFLATYMTCLFLGAISHVLSATVKSYQSVQMIQGMLISIFISLSGVAITGLPAFYRVLIYISPLFYGAKTLVMPQFEDHTGMMLMADETQGTISVPVRDYVASYLGWDYYTFSENILYVLAFILGIQILNAFAIKFINLQKK